MSEILAFSGRKTNAEAIEDCAKLGYIGPGDLTIDLTYGLGRFWTRWKPDELHCADLNPDKSPDFPDGLDATATGFLDSCYDVVVVDPPYKLNGKSGQGGPASSDADYGVDGDYMPVGARMNLMRNMLTEANRIVKPGGVVLYKCQAQVVSGNVMWQDRVMAQHAEHVGMRHIDSLFVEGVRAQPSGRRQIHARRNYSTLLVLQAMKR